MQVLLRRDRYANMEPLDAIVVATRDATFKFLAVAPVTIVINIVVVRTTIITIDILVHMF